MATPELPSVPEVPPEKVSTSSNEFVELPTGKPFRNTDTTEILRANATPIVLLVGSAKCGKTTLLASLHDSFQRGSSFAGYVCAGSKTLIGFEERCFDSRAASGGDIPTTLRTRPAEGLLFYHLRLRNEDLKTPIKHLLVADMSGELYGAAMDSATEMRKQTIIRRADHFVHLIDAGRLTSNEFRALTRSNATLLFRRCLEERMFDVDARVDVLLTKWDIAIARCGSEEKAMDVLRTMRDEIAKQLNGRVGRLRIESVASRPHFKSKLKPAYGLTEFFRSWVNEPPRRFEPRLTKFPSVNSDRMFDRFGFREFPEMFESGRNA
jgi:GTPase SAR1 family protein